MYFSQAKKEEWIDLMNNDKMIRAMVNNEILAFFVASSNLVETARSFHHTSPVATAALGRLLSGAVMMGDMLKNDDDKITIQITGDGPLGGILVTADTKGKVKGYVNNPLVILPAKANGHLDVGGAVGNGTLSVIKDMGLKDTYNGFVPLCTGEIAEDLTDYFLNSEQTPASVGLGVLMDKDTMSVKRAGGFILQVMPGASEETIEKLEENISSFGGITDRLMEEDSPEYLLKLLCKGLDYEITKEKNVEFFCDCSRDRVSRAIALLGDVELKSMINDNKPIEIKCQFCNKAYSFSVEDLKEIQANKERKN